MASGSGGQAGSEPIDAVIVGSGYGGAVAALRLAQAGYRAVVLERGLRWRIRPDGTTFATYEKPDGRAAWLSETTVDPMQATPVPIDRFTGILEGRQEPGMLILAGAGVGGGSLVNHGIKYQPSQRLFERVFPKAISYQEMAEVYYPRALSVLKPEPIPEDLLASPYSLNTRVFMDLARKAGLPTFLLPTIIEWDIVREEVAGRRPLSVMASENWYGINSGAKKSLDTAGSYLGLAESTGRVEVLPLHVVSSLGEGPEGRFTVTADTIDTNGRVLGQRTFVATSVFLGAGSVGTTELLLRAQAHGTLPRLNDQVGHAWAANGDVLGMIGGLGATNPGQGAPVGAMAVDHDNPLGPVAMGNSPALGAPDGSMLALGMGLPAVGQPVAATGAFAYDPEADRARLVWPGQDATTSGIKTAVASTWQRLCDAGTDEAHTPHMALVDGGITAHPLGGAALGYACDLDGRVRGYAGLLVTDGALVPGYTAGVNPSLTITALAERVLDKFLADPDRAAT